MISWPWDSLVLGKDEETGFPLYDRGYKAEELRAVLMRLFSNGVFDDTPSFVITPGENMSVLVSPGTCFIQGDIGYEASVREIVFTAASSQPRIDTVVLRWDNNIDARSIDLYVHQGVASATPVRPTLTRTESVWELGLADIYIPANTTSISAERITDTRLETARCGIVTPFTSIDTTTFYNQIQAALNKQIGELQDQTDTAVDLSQAALEGTLAGQLQNQIDDLDDGKVSKAGDTMTGTLTNTVGAVSTWIKMRDVAALKIPKPESGVTSGLSLKTTNGNWDIGTYTSDENLHIVYSSDSNYGSNTNTISQLSIPSDVKQLALQIAYPVGAIYLSWSSTSPASLFGGTWVQIKGYFLYAGENTSTGGSNSITLTTAQMPSHNHTGGNWGLRVMTGAVAASGITGNFGTGVIDTVHSPNTGGGSSHSNVPAFQSVYVWRRTA